MQHDKGVYSWKADKITTVKTLADCLVEFDLIDKESVIKVMDNPDNLLFDGLIKFVKNNKDIREGIYCLLNQIVRNNQDPTEILKTLIDQSANFRYIWEAYKDIKRLDGLSLEKVKTLHE